MVEFYAPKARAEAEAVEAVIWPMVKDRFADNTERWADILEHPQTGKFGVRLPEDWRDLGISISDIDISTYEDMKATGWFSTNR